MQLVVLTLFPEMFSALTCSGITRRAFETGLVSLHCINPRDFAEDKHQTVDDRPYGGGPGMVMKVAPLKKALDQARLILGGGKEEQKVIYLSPQGRLLNRDGVTEILGSKKSKKLILIAGRYEGVDERFLSTEVDEEWSIGDYVLSGGELPAMVMLDAIIRKLPGALGDVQSAEQDSFELGLLDCPHYTRPEVLNGLVVPDVLLSGDHQKIARWRQKQSLGRTAERRPDLLKKIELTETQRTLLNEYIAERENQISREA